MKKKKGNSLVKINTNINSRTDKVKEEHENIILEYFTNGFNGSMAVMRFRPHLDNHTAANLWQGIKNNPYNKELVQELQARLSAQVDVKAEHLTRELINYGYSDATIFAGLTVEELKALPPEQRRQIQSIEVTDKVDKYGNHIGQKVSIKLTSKIDALKELAKHIGYYERDNEQKSNKVNILQVLQKSNPDTLNALLKTITENEEQ